MPFGLVTQRQLDAKAEELRREIADASGIPEDIVREWNDWYTKFSALYARLRKRMDQTEPPPPPAETEERERTPAVPSNTAHLARRFRGF